MANWASDVGTEPAGGHGQDPVEAARVRLSIGSGAVVVHWSLSYDVYVNAESHTPSRGVRARVHAVAGLERDGVEIARWTLGADEAQDLAQTVVQARVTGTASGLFVDRAAGAGPRTYVLKVWNERPARSGMVALGTRTMICEER